MSLLGDAKEENYMQATQMVREIKMASLDCTLSHGDIVAKKKK